MICRSYSGVPQTQRVMYRKHAVSEKVIASLSDIISLISKRQTPIRLISSYFETNELFNSSMIRCYYESVAYAPKDDTTSTSVRAYNKLNVLGYLSPQYH